LNACIQRRFNFLFSSVDIVTSNSGAMSESYSEAFIIDLAYLLVKSPLRSPRSAVAMSPVPDRTVERYPAPPRRNVQGRHTVSLPPGRKCHATSKRLHAHRAARS